MCVCVCLKLCCINPQLLAPAKALLERYEEQALPTTAETVHSQASQDQEAAGRDNGRVLSLAFRNHATAMQSVTQTGHYLRTGLPCLKDSQTYPPEYARALARLHDNHCSSSKSKDTHASNRMPMHIYIYIIFLNFAQEQLGPRLDLADVQAALQNLAPWYLIRITFVERQIWSLQCWNMLGHLGI